MRTRKISALAVAAVALAFFAAEARAQDESQAVAGGGITVDGWTGKVDAREAARGNSIDDAMFAPADDGIHVKTGPGATYWKAGNTASGSYMVSATFSEPSYMALSNHPHPYGLFIAGQGLDTDEPEFLYCLAYGNGRYAVRGFGPESFALSGRMPAPHDAVNTAQAEGQPVTQEVTIHVFEDRVSCDINGTEVGSYPVSEIVAEGRLDTTDGIFGVRYGHNVEATFKGLRMTQH